jgi:hypothetical protein
MMRLVKSSLIIFLTFFAACTSLVLEPADFTWPVESVLKIGDDGNVSEERYSFSFNAKELFLKETEDSSSYMNKNLRVIRDSKGFYYMTSNNFKNVYVFTADEGNFSLKNKIEIGETSMENPAFNQRHPYIELLNGDKKIYLTHEGIKENEEE